MKASLKKIFKHYCKKHRIEKVLVVGESNELKGLITVTDFRKAESYPNSCKDLGRLRVGAAVGTGADTPSRVEALVEAGVDVIVVDTAHGHSAGVIERVRWVKQNFPQVQVMVEILQLVMLHWRY